MCDDPYEVLRLGCDATDADVRSAYRRRALETHPDKGGSADAFRQVVDAFEALCDVSRREVHEKAEQAQQKRSSQSPQAATASGQRVPQSAEDVSAQNQRRKKVYSQRVSPTRVSPAASAKRSRKHRRSCASSTHAAASSQTFASGPAPTAASSKDIGQACERKSSFVRQLIQELLRVEISAWKRRLAEFEDATLAEVEAFLSVVDGGEDLHFEISNEDCCVGGGGRKEEKCEVDKEDGKVEFERGQENDADEEEEEDDDHGLHQFNEDSAAAEAASGIGNDSATILALEWRGEEDVQGVFNVVDEKISSCDEDLAGRLRVSAGVANEDMQPQRDCDAAAKGLDATTIWHFCDPVSANATPHQVVAGVAGHDRVVGDGAMPAPSTVPSFPPPPQQSSTRRRTNIRGVSKCAGSFVASVGIRGMLLLSQLCPNVDSAIDFHIILVRLRQIVISKMQKGIDFPEALRKIDSLVIEERRQSQIPDMRLRYRYMISTMIRSRAYKTTRCIDEAIAGWKATEVERARRQAAARHSARQSRSKKRLLRLIWLLRAKVKHVMDERIRRRREKVLLDRWGVKQMPQGVTQASLHQLDDSVCAVLRLSDGSVRQGPLRRSLSEARVDAVDFSVLQIGRGDAAACAELERRDVAAMTAFFNENC
eukprot:TRINITY_DN34349_c0_g1_i1.p1 TRINITY_DN34349_c0_g1~~TRINITY_DN34349_c0_g1_i1.p1  ORF type:complete len:654 (-),score=129.12 TRINITY_DN34349_c0_g1_i1:31-1992(-)